MVLTVITWNTSEESQETLVGWVLERTNEEVHISSGFTDYGSQRSYTVPAIIPKALIVSEEPV